MTCYYFFLLFTLSYMRYMMLGFLVINILLCGEIVVNHISGNQITVNAIMEQWQLHQCMMEKHYKCFWKIMSELDIIVKIGWPFYFHVGYKYNHIHLSLNELFLNLKILLSKFVIDRVLLFQIRHRYHLLDTQEIWCCLFRYHYYTYPIVQQSILSPIILFTLNTFYVIQIYVHGLRM